MSNDYRRLATRISACTTNCLLSALVLVAGLGFGRQVLKWWADDDRQTSAASPLAQASAELGDPQRLHVLQFGDQPWSIRRRTIAGDRPAAAAALRADCRQVVAEVALPEGEPQQAELEFLRRLATTSPVDEDPGLWRLYEVDGAFPMVVGTHPRVSGTGATAGSNLAEQGHRVVIWGLAMPAGSNAWTLCTFQQEPPADGPVSRLVAGPIPPECRQTLSMRVVGGGTMVAFAGQCDATDCKVFYQRWFEACPGRLLADWRRMNSAWHARYAVSGPEGSASVDLRLGTDSRGRLTGLLLVTPEERTNDDEPSLSSATE